MSLRNYTKRKKETESRWNGKSDISSICAEIWRVPHKLKEKAIHILCSPREKRFLPHPSAFHWRWICEKAYSESAVSVMQNMFSQLCITLLAIERCRIDLSGEHKKSKTKESKEQPRQTKTLPNDRVTRARIWYPNQHFDTQFIMKRGL